MSDNGGNESGSKDEAEYEVERILAESIAEGKIVYLVKWQNYDDNQCTWEPAESFLTPATLADWQRQLANKDTLDDDEIAGVQARMDAFEQAQAEASPDENRVPTQSSTQRLRDLPLSPRELIAKRPRVSPPAPKQPDLNATTNSKKGIAQVVRPGQLTPTFSTVPKPRTSGINVPASSAAKPSGATISSISKPIPNPSNFVQPPKSTGPAAVTAILKPADANSNTVSIPTGPRKLSSSDGAPKASHTKNLTGQRFRSLSHRNSYAKKARREPAPDILKMDLRPPDEWSSGGLGPMNKAAGTVAKDQRRGSPLFVPEHNDDFEPQLEKLLAGKDRQRDSHKDIAERRSLATAVAAPNPAAHHTELLNLSTPGMLKEREAEEHSVPPINLQNLGLPQDLSKPASESQLPLNNTESRPAVAARTSDSPVIEETTQHGANHAGTTEKRCSVTRAGSESQGDVTSYAFAERCPPSVRRESHNSPEPERDVPIPPPKFFEVANSQYQGTRNKIVNLRFGAHEVGEVMLLDLPQWFSGKLNGLREESAQLVSIHFQEQYILTVEDFAMFAHHLERRQHGHFTVEASGNTLNAIESLCQYLESNDLGAIWEYPQPGDSLLLVLYSCRAPGWQHFGQVKAHNPRLHIALVNKVMGFFLANAPMKSDRPVAFDRNVDPPRPYPDIGRPQLQPSTSDETFAYTWSPAGLPTPSTATSTRRDSTFLAQALKSPGRRESMSLGDSMDWIPSTPAAESHISFSADFDTLVRGLDKQERPRVFITFAKALPVEARAVKDWLLLHLSARYIFSDEQKNDWEDFRGELSSYPSLILFHERHPCYCDIPYLYKYLRAASVWCYNVLFGRHSDTLSRLFPRGNVLCLTEDTLLNNSEGALAAMKSFEEGSIGKAQSWKLVLPPDFLSWVVCQVNESSEEVRKRHMRMLEIWCNLRKRSSEASSSKRRQDEDPERFIKGLSVVEDNELVISPKDLAGYVNWDKAETGPNAVRIRDAAFLEYFTGWLVMNVTKHRLFTVVDTKHTNKTEKHSCHIWFRDPASYGKQKK